VLSEHPYAASIVSDNLVETTMQDRLTITRTLKLKTDPNLNLIRDQNIGGHVDKKPTEEDLALILNTSGTTGKPKRVGLSHRILNNGAKHDIESHKMTSDDTTLIVMPMFHINAQVVSVLSTRLSGGRIVIANKFSASKFWHQVRENNVTWVSVVPTIINILLINQTANLAYDQDIRLRFVRCSSFALPLDKLKDFENRFNTRILEGYGMTETASQCTLNPFDAPKVGSAGKPFKTEVEILVNDEFTKEPHQVGEIAVVVIMSSIVI
jgi:Acyl-CoA synthetases (AMP-forming)/AMP-acid ligases II